MGDGFRNSGTTGTDASDKKSSPTTETDDSALLRASGFTLPEGSNPTASGDAPPSGTQGRTSPFSRTGTPADAPAAQADPPAGRSPFQRQTSPAAPQEVPALPAAQPAGQAGDQTQPARPAEVVPARVERVADRDASPLSQLPAESLTAHLRASRAMAEVTPGQPMSDAVRETFEQALRDAAKIDPKKIGEINQQLETELKTKSRVVNGVTLPSWTEKNETDLSDKLKAVQAAVSEVEKGTPEATRVAAARLEQQIAETPHNEIIRRGQLFGQLRELTAADKDPQGKLKAYLDAKDALDKFTKENAAGLIRRNIHQGESSVLHSKGVVSGLYALALEQTGTTKREDVEKIKALTRDAMADSFAAKNIPDLALIIDKYGIVDRQEHDDKVPGRVAYKRATEIMNDQTQGTMAQRLEKAKPFFEQSIGATDEIDRDQVNAEIAKIAKEAADIGEGNNPERMAELDRQAVELLDKLRQPLTSRLEYALALHNVALETNDKELSKKAATVLKSIEQKDPFARHDELVQGMILAVSADPPRRFTEEEARRLGTAEVERRKKEDAEAGKPPPEAPLWQKGLTDVLLPMAAMWGLSRLFRAGREGPYRNWQASRRAGAVEVEASPSLQAGEKPRLVVQDSNGAQREVEGVRKEDGKLRVKDGEKVEVVDLKKGEKLVLKVPPDANLTKEQAREAARKVLTPTRAEEAVRNTRAEFEARLAEQRLEIEQLRAAQEQVRTAGGATTTEAPARPSVGERVQYQGEPHSVAGENGRNTILHKPNAAGAAVAEQIAEADLKTKYEEVKVTVDGKAESRFIEKGHPENGAYRVTKAGGQNYIARDVSLSVVTPEQMRSATTAAPVAPERAGTGVAPSTGPRPGPEAPAAVRPAPERVAANAPNAADLSRVEVSTNRDGTVNREEKRAGERYAPEKLRTQTELSVEQIRDFEREVERLKKSDKVAERERGGQLEVTLKALKGEFGPETRASAHKTVLESTRAGVEREWRLNRGTISAGIGIAIVASAALAWYLGRNPGNPNLPKDPPRASVGGKQ